MLKKFYVKGKYIFFICFKIGLYCRTDKMDYEKKMLLMGDLYDLKMKIDTTIIKSCREKSLIKTKIDEAALWLHQIPVLNEKKLTKEDSIHSSVYLQR